MMHKQNLLKLSVVILMFSLYARSFGMLPMIKLEHQLPKKKIKNIDKIDRENKITTKKELEQELQKDIKLIGLPPLSDALSQAILPKEILESMGTDHGTAKELRGTCKYFEKRFTPHYLRFIRCLYDKSDTLHRWTIDSGLGASVWIRNQRLLDVFAFSVGIGDVRTTNILLEKLKPLKDVSDDVRYDDVRYKVYEEFLSRLLNNNRIKTLEAVLEKRPFGDRDALYDRLAASVRRQIRYTNEII